MTKITLKDYRAKCQEVDKLKNIVEKLQDQIDKLLQAHLKLGKNRNTHLNRKIKLYEQRKVLRQVNQELVDEVQELKGMMSREMRRNRELQKEIDDLKSQLTPDQSSGVNPDYDAITQPAGTTPVVPLSCTPGWGQLGFLEPDLSFMTIRPTSKLTIKSDLGTTPDSNITSDKKKRVAVIKVSDGGIMSYYEPEQEARKKRKIAKKLRWDDYEIGG